MESVKLAVIIINYATPEMTKACIESALPELRSLNGRIVLVDNDSPDKSGPKLKQWVTENAFEDIVEVILSPTNHGFSGGNNLGMRSCDAEYYLLLNSDTLVRDRAITTLLLSLENEPKTIGLATPRLEWQDGTPQISCFRYHSPLSEFIFSVNTNIFTTLLKRFNVPIDVSENASVYEWSSFACILIRSEVIRNIGYMDEGYFLYYEDVDYCKMAQNAGYQTKNFPNAKVVHLRGGSSPVKDNIAKKKRLPLYYQASRTRYFYKHYGFFGLLVSNFLWTIGASLSSIKSFLLRRPSPICEKQYTDIWFGFTQPLKQYRPEK